MFQNQQYLTKTQVQTNEFPQTNTDIFDTIVNFNTSTVSANVSPINQDKSKLDNNNYNYELDDSLFFCPIETESPKPKHIQAPYGYSYYLPKPTPTPRSHNQVNNQQHEINQTPLADCKQSTYDFICFKHTEEKVKKVCAVPQCKETMLLCTDCICESPDHLQRHNKSIINIQQFLNMAEKEYQNLPKNEKDLLERNEISQLAYNLSYFSEFHLKQYKDYIESEKNKFEQYVLTLKYTFEDKCKILVQQFSDKIDRCVLDIDDQLKNFKKEVMSAYKINEDYQQYDLKNIIPKNVELHMQQQLDLENLFRKVRDKFFQNHDERNIDLKIIKFQLQEKSNKLEYLLAHPPSYSYNQQELGHFQNLINALFNQLESTIDIILLEQDCQESQLNNTNWTSKICENYQNKCPELLLQKQQQYQCSNNILEECSAYLQLTKKKTENQMKRNPIFQQKNYTHSKQICQQYEINKENINNIISGLPFKIEGDSKNNNCNMNDLLSNDANKNKHNKTLQPIYLDNAINMKNISKSEKKSKYNGKAYSNTMSNTPNRDCQTRQLYLHNGYYLQPTEETEKLINLLKLSPDYKGACDLIKGELKLRNLPAVINIEYNKYPLTCISIINENYIAGGFDDGAIRIWHLQTNQQETIMKNHKSTVTSLAVFTTKNNQNEIQHYLVSGSKDKQVILWNLQDKTISQILEGHSDQITCIISLQDNRNIVTSSLDRYIIVWDMENLSQSKKIVCNKLIFKLHKISGSNLFASSDNQQLLVLWQVRYSTQNLKKENTQLSNKIEQILKQRVINCDSNILSLNSQLRNQKHIIMGCCEDGSMRIWNLNNSNDDYILMKIQGHQSQILEAVIIENIDYNQDDYYIFTCAKNDDSIVLHHIKKNYQYQKIQTFKQKGLKIQDIFTNSKMQIFQRKGVKQGECCYRLVVANQNDLESSLLFWDIIDEF